MRLLKPDWVALDEKPIFSIDIHPDGSRFATGGQGDNSGRVVIWNMAPIRDEKYEKDENCPKILCQMDNHLCCVNCVRWSNSGKYLASCGDDKLIMIWQTSRYGGMSSAFGSGVVNIEQWRVFNTLRGHNGDILDLAWSPNDIWLASCSIDNTIVIWNAQKFPEQVAVLKGHTSLVKGVTWDPVGKYVASQSDDKTLRVWRTLDWQQEACVSEPFQECGGTTHVLRLHWSPDGQYVVSAHAMNNSGPTAQIIEREGWKIAMDFVGHRKAITVVKFNPRILSKKIKKDALKPQQFTCCAIGSRDRSLSIWLTALKRPLVVTHDLFKSSILDISWSQTGMELLCCSWDGTVAYLDFTPEEVGDPLTQDEKVQLHQKLYGKSTMATSGGLGSQIIESAALLDLQKERQKRAKEDQEEKERREKIRQQQQQQQQQQKMQTPTKNGQPVLNGSTTPVQLGNKQIETRTKDGKRRITPIFLAPQPDFGETPLPFSSNSKEPTFSSSKEISQIVVEKQDTNSPTRPRLHSEGSTPPKSSSLGANSTDKDKITMPMLSPVQPVPSSTTQTVDASKPAVSASTDKTPERPVEAEKKDKDPYRLVVKRKLDTSTSQPPPTGTPPQHQPPIKRGPGRPRKDRSGESHSKTPATIASMSTPVMSQGLAATVAKEPSRVIFSSSSLHLPVPSINKTVSIQVSGIVGSETGLVLEVENDFVVSGMRNIHKLRCLRGGQNHWENLLPTKVLTVAGNSHMACVACSDHSVVAYSASSGCKLYPDLVLDSKVSVMRCSGHYLMVITSRGYLFVWNIQQMAAVVKSEPLVSIISNSDITIASSLLTEQGLPVLTLSTGKAYTYKADMGCWVLLSRKDDLLGQCSDHHSCQSLSVPSRQGPLATLQVARHKVGSQAGRLARAGHSLQQSATLGHLESQLSCCLALSSTTEYHFWLLTYVRYLTQEGVEGKLRELCEDLLGPAVKTKSTSKWSPNILGFSKRGLLKEILPLVGANLKLQRLYTEYLEQLDMAT